MKKIYINKNNLVAGPYIHDATIEVEVSDAIYEQVNTVSFYSAWKYEKGQLSKIILSDNSTLQERRQKECFNVVDNRSPMWYKRLTAEQSKELDTWYQAWLDVTDTKVIPTKPSWL